MSSNRHRASCRPSSFQRWFIFSATSLIGSRVAAHDLLPSVGLHADLRPISFRHYTFLSGVMISLVIFVKKKLLGLVS
ncbi:hypothetical protein TIFTF001_037839 [Ficus carica]|uniref:Uncharacterized protein n=1 Tax=Ficus carica TaxID=3494 RepID=A0AA88EHL2_FICCA|nr:hypothetical protein TIFTF001_037839 [Ficus carica]